MLGIRICRPWGIVKDFWMMVEGLANVIGRFHFAYRVVPSKLMASKAAPSYV
jgi:hypothetical protein